MYKILLIFNLFRTIPSETQTKKGKMGAKVDLTSNYFPLKKVPNWRLYLYRVDMKPEVDYTKVRFCKIWNFDFILKIPQFSKIFVPTNYMLCSEWSLQKPIEIKSELCFRNESITFVRIRISPKRTISSMEL